MKPKLSKSFLLLESLQCPKQLQHKNIENIKIFQITLKS
jgi:hypothetical protein